MQAVENVIEYFKYIFFPNLGITFKNVGDHISIFGFEIKYYGIVITLGFLFAYILVNREAKRTQQDPDQYLDMMLVMVIPAILGARIYYILFRLDDYIVKGNFKETILRMINIRGGGLAIYGGIIAGIITGVIFTKVKKMNFWQAADTATFGLLIGQILGRYGNFFNREAFGGYTDSKFAMAIPLEYYRQEGSLGGLIRDGIISQEMLDHTRFIEGIECIMVHPTFLYESAWNLMLLIFLYIWRKHKKFHGEFAFIYIAGYGIGRFLIEGLRADSLMIGQSGLKVSQLVGLCCFLAGAVALVWNYIRYYRKGKSNIEDI